MPLEHAWVSLAGGTASFVGLEPATVSSQPARLALSPALGMAALAHPGAALQLGGAQVSHGNGGGRSAASVPSWSGTGTRNGISTRSEQASSCSTAGGAGSAMPFSAFSPLRFCVRRAGAAASRQASLQNFFPYTISAQD